MEQKTFDRLRGLVKNLQSVGIMRSKMISIGIPSGDCLGQIRSSQRVGIRGVTEQETVSEEQEKMAWPCHRICNDP